MDSTRIENNQVTISGEIVSNFEFSHEVFGEGFYKVFLKSNRKSDASDTIPIMVSERLVDVKEEWIGQIIKVCGQFRSYNKHDENGKSHLELYVFAREVEVLENPSHFATKPHDKNKIIIDGYICKEPIYRKTGRGRDIAEIFLAVNRQYNLSDYIPCICWGRNAKFAACFPVGTRLKVIGRIQSREHPYGEREKKTVYEVSVAKMEVVEERGD